MKLCLVLVLVVALPLASAICTSESCCANKCKNEGFCCNTGVGVSSNQKFSCLQACTMRTAGDTLEVVQDRCLINNVCSFQHPSLGSMDLCNDCSDSTNKGECVYGVTNATACLQGATYGDLPPLVAPPPTPVNDGTCFDQSCCQKQCKAKGFCCDDNLHVSSNQLFSCLEACAMRTTGDSYATVEQRCQTRQCSYTHPVLGKMDLCSSCDDNTNSGECHNGGVNDNYACLTGASLGNNPNPPPPPPPPVVDTSTPTLLHPGSFYWGNSIQGAIQEAGFTWYTNLFQMFQAGYMLNMQVGLAGSWLTPYGNTYYSCPCNPNTWTCCDGGKNPCAPFGETIEGGPGYWMDEQPTSTTKWRPGMSAGCYTAYASTPLFLFGSNQPVACSRTWIVQVSNSLMMSPDGLQGDGLLGVGYVKTPIGKTNSSDTNNYYTMMIDAVNYQGPLAYILPDYWTQRDPNRGGKGYIADFSDSPQVSIASPAFEWNTIQTYETKTTYKLPPLAAPVINGAATFLTEMKGYKLSDTQGPIEQVLETGKPNTNNIMSNGVYTGGGTAAGDAQFRVDGDKYVSVGRMHTIKESDGAYTWQMTINNNTCTGKDLNCFFPEYFDTTTLMPVDPNKVPSQLRKQVFSKKGSRGAYNAINTPASGGCQTSPGPADNTLYCVKTNAPSYVAFKWYRFVDQPAFQHLHLSSAEKSYMQGRIENLHKAYPAGRTNQHWIKSENVEKYGLAMIDQNVLLRPPSQFAYGYVPIPFYEGTSRPSGCHMI